MVIHKLKDIAQGLTECHLEFSSSRKFCEQTTANWDFVTCRKCLAKLKKGILNGLEDKKEPVKSQKQGFDDIMVSLFGGVSRQKF